MSNDMLDTLENKVFSAIETIELLRTEINELKEERNLMQRKVRDLIQRIENAEANTGTASLSASSPSIKEGTSSSIGNFGRSLERTGTDF
ncbi:MAG: cell division protein ZapB [Candidatus Lambdaproteobacteria bacterium]|nr:cell division protein ZapB [Candidatus Lambdaproteobacteria bacterium]